MKFEFRTRPIAQKTVSQGRFSLRKARRMRAWVRPIFFFAVLAFGAAPSLAEEDPVERANQYVFDSLFAQRHLENCPGLEFDQNAARIERLQIEESLIATGRTTSVLSARRTDADFAPYGAAFDRRHGFDRAVSVTLRQFCGALIRELVDQTSLGRLLTTTSVR